MNTDRLNYLNIVLMAIAAMAAFLLPFEVFLFAYAVLGPLHYLTEISWLHEKGYFTRKRHDYIGLALVAVVLLALLLLALKAEWFFGSDFGPAARRNLSKVTQGWGTAAIYAAFASALVMVTVVKPLYRAFALLFIVASAIFLRNFQTSQVIFSVFLPTLIHVFVFTGAFILYGALKGRSKSGLISFAAFLLFPVLLWAFNGSAPEHVLSLWVEEHYKALFAPLNRALIQLFHLGTADTPQDILYSSYGLLVMRFIAFAYAYHYLNWFSKTKIIRWHEVSKGRIAFLIGAWVLSLALYGYNYRVGLVALYCLSFMHVFLEFPLNHLTFLGISKELSAIARSRSFVRPAVTMLSTAAVAAE